MGVNHCDLGYSFPSGVVSDSFANTFANASPDTANFQFRVSTSKLINGDDSIALLNY